MQVIKENKIQIQICPMVIIVVSIGIRARPVYTPNALSYYLPSSGTPQIVWIDIMDWLEIRKSDWNTSQPPSQQSFLLIAAGTLELGILERSRDFPRQLLLCINQLLCLNM